MDKPILPEHPQEHQGNFQHPVQAVQIFLDRALAVMIENEAIQREDWKWFLEYLDYMRSMETKQNE